MRFRRRNWWLRAGLAAAALLALFRCMVIVRDFAEPTELMHTTSVPIFVAREIQNYGSMYRSFGRPPYVLSLYGPLLYGLPGLLARGRELTPTEFFMLGRGLSLSAFAFVIAGTGAFMRRWGRSDRATTTLLVLILFVSPIAWPICMEVRADVWELLFSLCGLALFIRFETSRWRLCSLACFLIAFLFKQSAVAGPLSLAAYLLLKRRTLAAAEYGLLFAVSVGGCIVILNGVTSGAYWLNCFAGLHAHLTVSNLWTVWSLDTLISALPVFTLAAWRLARRCWRQDPLTVYTLAGCAWACLGVLRDGSGVNYFLAPLVTACIVGARELALLRRRSERMQPELIPPRAGRTAETARAAPVFLYAILLAGLVTLLLRQTPQLIELPERTLTRQVGHGQREFMLTNLARRLNHLPGPVLCEDGTLNLYLDRPLMMDTLTFSGLADQGVFDDARMIERIRANDLAAFVLRFALEEEIPRYQSTARLRREWSDAMRSRGYVERRRGWFYVYVRPDLLSRFEPPPPA